MDVGALGRSVTAVLRVVAASCGSRSVVHTRYFDARLVRAAPVEIRTVAGLFLAALRAAGWRTARPHPAGSWVARRTNAPPASLPAELPVRTTYRVSALVTPA